MELRSSWAVALVAAAALTGTTTGIAQTPARGLTLKIETERQSYALGEPVYLIVRVLNQGTAEAKLMPLLSPKDGLLAISVRDPAGRGIGFQPLASRDRDSAPVALAPGGQLATTFPIFFGATGWLFRDPGRYMVRAQFDVRAGAEKPQMVQAEPLVLTIRDEGAEGARVLMDGSAASLEAGKFLVWGSGDHLVQGMERLNQFAARTPTSPAIDHYRVALGRSWARPFKNYKLGAVRPAEYPRALTELARARDEMLPSVVRLEKYLAQATSLFGTGRSPEAVDAVRRARALVNERPELAEFGEQVERLEGASRPKQ
jgi:hypothetical protein